MKRNEFVFSIGFQGNAAIVDSRAMKKYGGLDTRGLAEKGLFRAALCSALYSGSQEEEEMVAGIYKDMQAEPSGGVNMKRLIGVYEIPRDIVKVIRV